MAETTQFGWCSPLERAGDVAAAGLGYLELQLVPLGLEGDAAFAEAKSRLRDAALPVRAMSYLFPHDVRLVGDRVDEGRIRRYFDRVVDLLRLTDAQVVVLGSGWTRNVPEGGLRERTQDQFLQALGWFADALQGGPTTLVIEPLNRKESNFCNSVDEGVALARRLGRPQVRALADFYHMDEEREPLSTLRDQRGWLGHVHLADRGRLQPGSGQGQPGAYDYGSFFAHLSAIGYAGLMSAECGFTAGADPVAAMRASHAFLCHQWEVACHAQ